LVLLIAVVKVGVAIPFFEEFFFRGIVQSTLARTLSPAVAIAVASAIFATAHFTQPQAVPSIFLLSLGLGYVFYRSQSLVAPWIMHSLFNSGFVLVHWLGAD
jgi:hypothetical protein